MRNPIRKTIIFSVFLALGMFGFSFALSPLYNALCKNTAFTNSVRISGAPILSREIIVQFIATNNENMPWDFYPDVSTIRLHPEENKKIFFIAKNPTHKTMTVQAIPSFSPLIAGRYFHKIQCFCFNRQTLRAGQEVKMPIVFRIDKDLPPEITTITLAYTLFDVSSKTTLTKKGNP